MPLRNALADLIDDRSQAGPHRHLDQASIDDLACECEDFSAFAALRANAGEPFGSMLDDWSNIRVGLNIIDQCRSFPESTLCWIGWSWAGLPSLALDAGNKSGFFAANIGPSS